MSPAAEMVRSVVIADLRRIEDWHQRSGQSDTRAEADAAITRFLQALGHGAIADLWQRVR